jgi:hypothetical protein
LFPSVKHRFLNISHPSNREESAMSSHESEQVLILLKELSLLKELDNGYEVGPKTESERDAHQRRHQRHHEIAEEIKALAAQKKNDAEQSELSGL